MDVTNRLRSFGKVVSEKEVETLQAEVTADKVDPQELGQLQQGAQDFKFTDAGRRNYNQFVGAYALGANNEVVREFSAFSKTWKLEKEPAYRQKWGATDLNSPKLPTFEKGMALSDVPAALGAKFVQFATEKKNEFQAKGYAGWGSANPQEDMQLTSANRIYDAEKNPVGYVLTAKDSGNRWIESYYRNDGTPVSFDYAQQRD